jgi:hypothetical protein
VPVNKRIGAMPWETADPWPQAVNVTEIMRIDATTDARHNVMDAAISSGGPAWLMRI